MKRWLPFLAGTLLGLLVMDRAWSVFDPLLRSESASDLTAAQHDTNWSSVATEVNGKQPLDTDLTALAALAGQTAYGQSLLTMADATALRAQIIPGAVLVAQMDCVPPASLNASPGTLLGTSTPNEQSFQYWAFADAVDSHLDCSGRLPDWFVPGTIILKYCWASSAASGNVAVTAAWRNPLEDLDSTAQTYAYQSTTLAMSATIGTPACGALSFTSAQIDGLAAGGWFNLRIQRDGDNGAADTSTGIGQLFERSIVLVQG